ncbi:hypothetical protein Hanom_Chr01g00048461 [Helianthus anomalus]
MKLFSFFFFFFFLNKKTSPLRVVCRHQIEGVRGVKRGVDVARADWPCVREGTPLREECPSHPNTTYFIPNQTQLRHNKYVIY